MHEAVAAEPHTDTPTSREFSVPQSDFAPVRRASRALALRALAFCAVLAGVAAPACASDTRALSFYNTHTEETLTVTFKRDGRYVPEALDQLNRFLRDWRRNEVIRMDPQLFDLIWQMRREVGSEEPVHIICGYRSPTTNETLRSRGRGVARHSQHTLGKAIDLRFPDVPISRVREAGMKMQVGGVGFYPGSSFVHVDTGSVRAWPRMTRDQLVRLFPDGKTAHLPADGRPLPGYEQAVAEVQRRKSGQTLFADARSGWRGGLLGLFRGFSRADEEEPERSAVATRGAPAPAAQDAEASPVLTARPASTPTTVAVVLPTPRPTVQSAAETLAFVPPARPAGSTPAAAAPPAADAPAETRPVTLAALPPAKPSALVGPVAQPAEATLAALPPAKPAVAASIPPMLAKLDTAPVPAAASAYAPVDHGDETSRPKLLARPGPRITMETVPLRYDNRAAHLLIVETSVAGGQTISRLSPPRPDIGTLTRAPAVVIDQGGFSRRGRTLRTDAFLGSATTRVPTLTFAPRPPEATAGVQP